MSVFKVLSYSGDYVCKYVFKVLSYSGTMSVSMYLRSYPILLTVFKVLSSSQMLMHSMLLCMCMHCLTAFVSHKQEHSFPYHFDLTVFAAFNSCNG